MKNVVIFMTMMLIISCSNNDDIQTKEIELEFLSDDIVQISNPNFTLSIFGYDRTQNNNTPSLIVSKNFKKLSLPFRIKIMIPNNPSNLINPSIKDASLASYFVKIDWDSNDDGKICTEDLIIDYNKNTAEIDLEESDTQLLYLTKNQSTICN